MASSPPLNRRRIVGLNDPRSARAQANDAEAQRLAMRQIVHQDNVGLDIPSSESDDEFNLDSPSQSPPRQNRAAEQGAAANAVAPICDKSSARRHQETGIFGLATMQN